MKRIFALILILAFMLSAAAMLPTVTAVAEEGEYLLVERDNVSLYADTQKAPALFTLPRTYFVKVIERNYSETYHLVEYNGVQGLVKISEVSAKTQSGVQDPYYTTQSISAHISTHLYKRPSFAESEDSGIVAYGLSLTYLGKISGEKGTYGTPTWFAVLYSGSVYYIHSAMTENIDLLETSIPLHPNAATQTSAEVSNGGTTEESAQPASSVDIVRILLIVGIFVPIIIILVVLFRPPKKRSRNKSGDDEGGY